MTVNTDKLRVVFIEALGLSADSNVANIQYNSITEWDSLAHMALVAAIEDAFDIMLDTEDIIEMNSFSKAREIVSKHGVSFG